MVSTTSSVFLSWKSGTLTSWCRYLLAWHNRDGSSFTNGSRDCSTILNLIHLLRFDCCGFVGNKLRWGPAVASPYFYVNIWHTFQWYADVNADSSLPSHWPGCRSSSQSMLGYTRANYSYVYILHKSYEWFYICDFSEGYKQARFVKSDWLMTSFVASISCMCIFYRH